MKRLFLSRLRLISLLGLAALLTGCAGLTPSAQTQARIQEKTTVYQALKPEQQNDVLGGAIERGNTIDMVYLSLGKPGKVVTSADGSKAMWVYTEYYSPSNATTLSFNNPNSSHYTPGITGATAWPARGGEGAAWLVPASMGTDGVTPVASLAVPEMRSKTVYVFFFNGQVCEIKLDGDSSDQRTAAANVTLPKRIPTKEGFTRSAYGDIDH